MGSGDGELPCLPDFVFFICPMLISRRPCKAATLATSPSPELLAEFYSHLTKNEPAFASEASQQRLSIQLRDILLKMITLVGAPQALCALMPLAKAEGNLAERSAQSALNDKWCVKKNNV